MKTKPFTFLLALTFLFLFSGSVFGQEEVKKEYWDNGKLKSETHYKNGERDGLQTHWYETGEKHSESHWKNGVRKEYWDNGKLKNETHYKNGVIEGLGTGWYESGEKERESHYKKGKVSASKFYKLLMKLSVIY